MERTINLPPAHIISQILHAGILDCSPIECGEKTWFQWNRREERWPFMNIIRGERGHDYRNEFARQPKRGFACRMLGSILESQSGSKGCSKAGRGLSTYLVLRSNNRQFRWYVKRSNILRNSTSI